jgi:predicted Zn finger-like uncharacterized protein
MNVRLVCPSCHSQFKVTEEQIKPHQSLVCCGHCFTLFNAQGHKTKVENTKHSSGNSSKNATKSASLNAMKVLLLLLLLSGALQALFYLRSQISWHYPNSKPYIALVCKQLGCEINLAKQINLLVLDDTDLLEDEHRVGLMHLSSTIVNQAAFSQAYPSIELILTDIEDRAKFKARFSPNDYLSKANEIKRGIAPGQTIKLDLPLANPDAAIVGYRVRLFY